MVHLNNKIKQYRKDANLTQSDLAKLVGVRRETIARIERDLYNPSLLLAEKIARAFGASIYDVFSFEEDDIRLNQSTT